MTNRHRLLIADFIVSVEARRDKNGKLRVYPLPPADGGGTYEVAGINDRFHPVAAQYLRSLVTAKRYNEAEAYIRSYIADYTDIVNRWTTHTATQAFLRDCVFNRGPRGALRIMQLAIGVADDGKFGPKTKAALDNALKNPRALLTSLRNAREQYELRVAPPVGARKAFWRGLVNRWNKALEFAQSLL
jgi:lysozyme family protein